MLHILTGRVGSGKTYTLLSRAAKEIEDGQQGLLLVPEQYTLTAEHELLDRLSVPGLLFTQVVSPSRLARNALERLGRPVRPVVDERGQAMMLRKVFTRGEDQWEYYGRLARNSGFFCEMASFISDMKRFRVDDKELQSLSENGMPGVLGRKMRDISRLYGLLAAEMDASGVWNTEERMAAYIEAVPTDPVLDGMHIWMDGFDYLPPLSVALICALAKKCPSVTVTLDCADPGDGDFSLFSAGQQSLDRLLRTAEDGGILWKREHLTGSHGRNPGLREAERQLFWDNVSVTETNAITFTRTADTTEEVLAAADRVRRLVMEGCHYSDIQVACSNLKNYEADVAYYWEKLGIPFYLDTKRDAMGHPAVELLMAALDFLAWGWRWPDLLRVVKTGLTSLTEAEILTVQHYLQAVQPVGYKGIRREWNRQVKGVPTDTVRSLQTLLLTPFAEVNRQLGREATAGEWRRALVGMLSAWGVEKKLQKSAEEKQAAGDSTGAQEDLQVWKLLLETMEQLEALSGEGLFDAVEVKRLMETGLKAASIGSLPGNRDAVLVGDIGRTKTRPRDHVLLLGATEDWLPTTYPTGGILSPREARMLAENRCEIGRNMEVRYAQSRFAVYACLAKTGKKLWVFFPEKDSDGGVKQPSSVWLKLLQITGGKEERFSPASSVLPYVAMRWLIPRVGEQNADIAALRTALAALPEMEAVLENQLRLLNLPEDYISGGLPRAVRTSVSKMETYASCPFHWFMHYMIRPQQPDSLVPDAVMFGDYRHAALQRVLAVWGETGEHTREWMLRQINRVNETLQQDPRFEKYNNSAVQSYAMERLCQDTRITAEDVLLQYPNDGYQPAYLEMNFGWSQGREDISMHLPDDREVKLEGKVDRVDVLPIGDTDLLRVVDYKTGKGSVPSVKSIQEDGNLQAWIYMTALLQRWETLTGRKAQPGGVYTMPTVSEAVQAKENTDSSEQHLLQGTTCLREDVQQSELLTAGVDTEAKSISPAEFTEALTAADDVLQTMLERAVGGDVRPMPAPGFDSRTGELTACTYCDYRAGCRFRLRDSRQPCRGRLGTMESIGGRRKGKGDKA